MNSPILYHIALSLIAFMFLNSGVTSLLHPQPALALIKSKNLPFARFGLYVVIAVKLVAGTMLLCQVKVQLAAAALATFMVVVTFIFQNFWAYEGRERISRYHGFLSNVALTGALLLIVSL